VVICVVFLVRISIKLQLGFNPLTFLIVGHQATKTVQKSLSKSRCDFQFLHLLNFISKYPNGEEDVVLYCCVRKVAVHVGYGT
jgi:hypothetical protein